MISKEMVGRTVVLYEPYARKAKMLQDAFEATIDSVGRKYAQVGRCRFDCTTMACPDMNLRLYMGTLEEFREAVELLDSTLKKMEAIRQKIDIFLPLGVMKDIDHELTMIMEGLEYATE